MPFFARGQPMCCTMPAARVSTASSALRFRHGMPFGEAALPRSSIRPKPLSDFQVSLIKIVQPGFHASAWFAPLTTEGESISSSMPSPS